MYIHMSRYILYVHMIIKNIQTSQHYIHGLATWFRGVVGWVGQVWKTFSPYKCVACLFFFKMFDKRDRSNSFHVRSQTKQRMTQYYKGHCPVSHIPLLMWVKLCSPPNWPHAPLWVLCAFQRLTLQRDGRWGAYLKTASFLLTITSRWGCSQQPLPADTIEQPVHIMSRAPR